MDKENIGYCFLAIGDKYVKEFLSIAKYFPNENIVVCSDRELPGFNTVITNDPFNFHLRALAIGKALQLYDTVVSLDVDHRVTPFSKKEWSSLFNSFKKGFTTKWIWDSVEYLDENITSYDLENSNTKYEDVNLYGAELKNIINSSVKFLDESVMVFKLSDKEKELFMENYFDIISKTKNKQPYRFTDKKMGALEGCLIYSALYKTNITINSESNILGCHFYHYGPSQGHNVYTNKTFI